MARSNLNGGPGVLAVATAVAVIGGAAVLLVPGPQSETPPGPPAMSGMSAVLPAQPGPADAEEPGPADAESPGAAAIDLAPTFDVVRAEADGSVLVAGTAGAGHRVRVEVDGRPGAAGAADAQGYFVLFLDLPRAVAPRVLDLVATGPDGTERRAPESVVLAPSRLAARSDAAPPGPEGDVNDEVQAAGMERDMPEPEVLAAAPPSEAAALREGSAVADAGAPPHAGEPRAPVSPAAPAAQGPGAAPAPRAAETAAEARVPAPEAAAGSRAEARVAAPAAAPARSGTDAGAAAAGPVQADPVQADPVQADPVQADPVQADPVQAEPQRADVAQAGAAQAQAGPADAARVEPARTVASAPAVLIAGAQGVRLLQPAAASEAADRVIVDVISYDADGTVRLEGRGAPPPPPVDRVRVYLDNAPVQDARIAEDGTWRLPLRDVASGVYTLRVDQLDSAGNVVSRFETPFKREDPAELARLSAESPPAEGQVQAAVITVQPGYTLWGIADDRYGSGFDYVAIFEANDDQIRDPDLIYPGQVFDLPDLPAREP